MNFESLTKNIESPPHHQQHNAHHPNFLSAPHGHNYHNNQGHYSTGHFDNNHYHQNIPQYDRAQYVTMNINMNMYPKVLNMNMNPQQTTNNYLQQQPNINTFANQFLGQQQQQFEPLKKTHQN